MINYQKWLASANGIQLTSWEALNAGIVSTTKSMAIWLTTTPAGWATMAGVALAGVVLGVNAYNKKQEELREEAEQSAQEIDNQTKSLDELKNKYIEICDSTEDEATKSQQLNDIKQELVDVYGFEKDALKELNDERERGLALLDGEFEKKNRNSRNNWLEDNKDNIKKANEEMASDGVDYFTTYLSKNNIASSILELFDKQEAFGDTGYVNLEFDYTDTADRLNKLKNIYNEILDVQSKRSLTADEEQLLSDVKTTLDSVQGVYDKYYDIYSTAAKYNVQNLVENYLNTDEGKIENVGKDTFKSWSKGLLDQAENAEQKRQLENYIEEAFPDLTKYFNNLDKAYDMFGIDDVINDANEGMKKAFINGLDDAELEIATQIPDLFADGLDGATAKIKEWSKKPENAISFNIAEYQEDLETVYGNIENLQDAISKLDENKFDFSGDIQDLIKAFPEYSTEILNASGDTEQLRKVLQELLNSQPNDLINSLTELKGSLASDEDIKAVDNLINILRNSASVAYSVTSLSDSLQDLNDKESILSTVWKEMNDDGYISVSTYKSLCEMGEDYADIVSIVDDKLTLNVDALKELTKKKYEDEIATLRLTRAEEWHNAIIAGKNGEDTSKYTAIIDNIDAEIEAKKNVLKLYENYDYKSEGSSSSDDDTPKSVKNFETELAKRQHEINLGLRKEDASYYDWLLGAAHKAYDGLADYEEELWKYEEQVYEWRKDHEQDLFDQKIENLDKEKEKALENNDFSTAKTSVNTQITETQKRIYELKASGKQDVDDEIKALEEDLEDLGDTLNDICSKEYEFKISLKTSEIDDLDREFEKSGDTSIYDKQIEIYTGLIADAQNEIDRLINEENYSMDSEEIQNLKEQIEGYSEDIANIWEKQTDVIKDNVDEQIEALDRSIENTGDTKLYSEKIKVYKDGQQQILDMIKFYRKQGYAEDSAIIKELKKQWNDYQDSISDALQEQANAQVEAYNELLDEQKELLEQQKEAQDEYYDSEIKALEDKKEALEKVNETIEEQNELEEKRQAIAEAERNLYKNVRLVYSGGQWVQKAREEDLQAVKDAEKDLSDTLRQQEIEALENQITALNDAKDEYDEAIDKQITAIEESEKAFEKAMENSYKVRQQLDYEFISAIVGDDKAKEYQTNADNALKAIAEAEKTDSGNTDSNTESTADSADNSALIDSNNAVAETNREVAESNLQKLSADDALKSIYNSFQKSGALLKGTTFEKFAGNIQGGALNATLNTAPKIADDIVKGSMVNNYTVNNNPTITNNITNNISGVGLSSEEVANEIVTTCNSAIGQAFSTYERTFNNTLTKIMYGNT